MDLPQKEIDRIFKEVIIPQIIGNISPQDHKEAFILGGQPGSGKSALARKILLEINKNTVFINGDDLRVHHPKYYFYLTQNDQESADLTQEVCNYWIEALIRECADRNLNMIIEGTMRRKEVPLSTARFLKEEQYSVNIAAVSTPYELSVWSLEFRYNEIKRLGEFARYTKKSSHDEAYANIENTLTELLDSGFFDSFYIYLRNMEGFQEYVFNLHEKEQMLETFKRGRDRAVEDEEKDFIRRTIKLDKKDHDFPLK